MARAPRASCTDRVARRGQKWYRKAAEQGYTAAQNNLGTMYGEGEGVPQDYVLAHMWFNLAAAQGDEIARKNREIAAK